MKQTDEAKARVLEAAEKIRDQYMELDIENIDEKRMKEVLDEASPDQIEIFIEKNKNSGVSDETLENIKTKVFQKTGIENNDTKDERLKSIVGKNKKTYIRRWIYAAVILLAVAVALGIKHFNFGNPPVTNSEEQSTDNFSKDNSTNRENSNEILSEDISDNTPDNFEIINWATTSDVTWREEYLNVVNSLLWSGDKKQFAWAKVILEKLTPLGVSERENNSPLYQSIAEIKIIIFGNLNQLNLKFKPAKTNPIINIKPLNLTTNFCSFSFSFAFSLFFNKSGDFIIWSESDCGLCLSLCLSKCKRKHISKAELN